MTYRKVPLVFGEFFHIYNRGNSKQKIFIDDEDKDRFVKLLYLHNSKNKINFRDDIIFNNIDAFDYERGESIVSIGAYALMPNHFHIYITSSPTPGVGEESNISLFMRKVCTSYVKYFNTKYNRTGSLFEGRFKSVHIDDEPQAMYLFAYIHLNPIKLIQYNWKENGIGNISEAIQFLKSYKWSSLIDYLKIDRKENKILNKQNFLSFINNKDSIIEEAINFFNKNIKK